MMSTQTPPQTRPLTDEERRLQMERYFERDIQVENLKDEIRDLKDKLRQEKQRTAFDFESFFQSLWIAGFKFLGWLMVAFAAATVIYTFEELIRANGRPDYCYLEHQSRATRIRTTVADNRNYEENVSYEDFVMLIAHRPWRADYNIGGFKTVEDARHAADTLQCPMDSKK